MAKTTVTVPANGGPIEAVSTIESVPYWTRSRRKTGNSSYSFTVDFVNFKMEDGIFMSKHDRIFIWEAARSGTILVYP